MASERSPPQWNGDQLLERLGAALSAPALARVIVAEALIDAGRSELPSDTSALFAFVRAHLAERLVLELGPRAAMTLLDDFRRLSNAAPTSAPPPRALVSSVPARSGVRTKVFIADTDPLARASLARTLLQAGCDLLSAELPTLDETPAIAVILVRARDSLIDAATGLTRFKPKPVILALVASGASDAERMLQALGFDKRLVMPLATPLPKVRELVVQLAG